jgi:hypothetical protein
MNELPNKTIEDLKEDIKRRDIKIAELEAWVLRRGERIIELSEEYAELEKMIEGMKTALEYYADYKNYRNSTEDIYAASNYLKNDEGVGDAGKYTVWVAGNRAREALKQINNKGEKL